LTVVSGLLLRSGLFTVITLMIGCSINRGARPVMRRNRNDSVTNNIARQLFAQRIRNGRRSTVLKIETKSGLLNNCWFSSMWRADRLGLSRLPELKSCHTEHAFEVNLW
jgi:hypothetical protein